MRLLRLPLNVRKIGFIFPSAALGILLAFSGGCETKSFIDPSEVGRYEHDPLLKPILSSLSGIDSRIEDPTQDFLNTTEVRQADLQVREGDYNIGKNDLLSISISDLMPDVDTVKTVRVSESGNITLPLIGQLKASGLTEAQLEQAVTERYRDAQLIENAQVSVIVTEARARTFGIMGAVAQPGTYAILNSDFRMLDALVLARSVTAPDIDYIYVLRKVDEDAPATAEPMEDQPATQPDADLLEPSGRGGQQSLPSQATLAARSSKVLYLQNQEEPVDPAPANESEGPATTRDTDEDGVYIQLDGKSRLIDGAMENNEAAADAAGSESAESMGQEPGFEFNDVTAQEDIRVIRVPLKSLRNGDLRYNIVIRPGDLVIVPEPVAGVYYMGGHVRRVGVYSLTGQDITLKQAVVSAGMLDPLAIPARTDIIRRVGPNQEIFVRVDLDKIWAGQQPDIYLKPDDIVQVGTNLPAPFLAAIRNAFRVTYGFGFLYDRNFAVDEDDRFNN